MNRGSRLLPAERFLPLGLVLALGGFGAEASVRAETVGQVVATDGTVCGWAGDVGPTCDRNEVESQLFRNRSIDRGMTVQTAGDGEGLHACVMTIDQRFVDGGGAVIMRPETMIRISDEVIGDFGLMEQLEGVLRVVLRPDRAGRNKLGIKAGTAFVVLHGTYVEIRIDKRLGTVSVGVVEGWATVESLIHPGPVPPGAPPSLPDLPPEGAPRTRVHAGEQVDVTADGAISPPYPFPRDAPASDSVLVIEDESVPTEPGMEGPGSDDPFFPELICDLPRMVCDL